MHILPSIDLRGGRVVRLRQGDYDRQITYDLDPIEVAAGFEAAGAAWMHVVDLDGAKEGRVVQAERVEAIIRSTRLSVEVGGGVRSEDDIRRLLDAGAQRVVVGTRAIEAWDWFAQAARTQDFAGRLVLALDARDGRVATRGWTRTSGRLAVDVAREVDGWPLAAILCTDVSRDGMLEGPNLELSRDLARAGRVPVIASGGVGDIAHVRALLDTGAWGAIVGRSLYEGKVDLAQAIRVAAGKA